MIASTLFLATALLGGPSPKPAAHTTHDTQNTAAKSCIAPEHTGTFRVMTTSPSGAVGAPAILMLENIYGCLEATYVTDESSPVIIDQLRVTGNSLNGSMRTSSGAAKVSLDFDGSHVGGSIVQGRQTWIVDGRKTS